MKITKRQLRRIIREEISRDPKTISEISIPSALLALDVLGLMMRVPGVKGLVKKTMPGTYDSVVNSKKKLSEPASLATTAAAAASGNSLAPIMAVQQIMSNPKVSSAIRDRAPDVYVKASSVAKGASQAVTALNTPYALSGIVDGT